MSRQQCPDPRCARADGPVRNEIEPVTKDLGGFTVRRVLPAPGQRSLGPFIFFDEMGPSAFDPGQGIDVRPHPHIGLATLTYLFEGEITHRDSLGVVQSIRPGAVNWMTAGRGIVHSERTGPRARAAGSRLHGIQTWIALPRAHEETDPAFFHHPAESLPVIQSPGVWMRLIVGTAYGRKSPVATWSELFYLDVRLDRGAQMELPGEFSERGVYLVSGSVIAGGVRHEAARMLIPAADQSFDLTAEADSRLILLGGDPLPEPRHMWWNLVSTRRERIEQAKADWKAGRFPVIPGETEFIPLPED